MSKRLTQLIRMLEGLPAEKAEAILAGLRQRDPDLADQLAEHTLVFEDLRYADDKGMRALLEKTDRRDLYLALRGAGPAVLARVVDNLSTNAGAELKDALETMPPQRRRDVDRARTAMVAAGTRLRDEGKLVIERPGGGEEYV